MSWISRSAWKQQQAKLSEKLGIPAPRPDEGLVAYELVVGKPYPLDYPRDVDGTHLSVDEQGFGLSIYMQSPSPGEIAYVQEESLEARVRVGIHTLFLFVRMGGGHLWFEGNFSPWRAAAAGRGLYEVPPQGYGMLLQICLIDTTTGILRSLRQTTLGRDFCVAVLGACHEIVARPIDDDAHMREVHAHVVTPIEVAAEQATLRWSATDAKVNR